MNKLIIMPLILLFLLTCISVIEGATPEPQTVEMNTTGHADEPTIWNLYGLWGSAVDGDSASNSMSWSSTAIIASLVVAMIIGAAIGLNIIGSGLSPFSQKMVFIAMFYLPLWGILTVNSASYFFSDFSGDFGPMLYVGVTIFYAIGVASEINNVVV